MYYLVSVNSENKKQLLQIFSLMAPFKTVYNHIIEQYKNPVQLESDAQELAKHLNAARLLASRIERNDLAQSIQSMIQEIDSSINQ